MQMVDYNKLDSNSIFTKEIEVDKYLKEVLISNIAYNLGLIAPFYIYNGVSETNKIITCSKDLNSFGKFHLAKDIINPYYNLISFSTMCKEVFNKFGYDERLYVEMLKMYALDFSICNNDRHVNNFGFIETNLGLRLGLIDHERSFLITNMPLVNMRDYSSSKCQEDLSNLVWFKRNRELFNRENFVKEYINNFRKDFEEISKIVPSKYHGEIIDVFKMINPVYLFYLYCEYFKQYLDPSVYRVIEEMHEDVVVNQRFF